MAYPPHYRKTPSMRSSFNSPIPIRGQNQPHVEPPPPLPPPKFPPLADAPQASEDMRLYNNNRERENRSSSSLASGYGSMTSYLDDRSSFKRRDNNIITADEGYASYASPDKYAVDRVSTLSLDSPSLPLTDPGWPPRSRESLPLDMRRFNSKHYLQPFPSFQPDPTPAKAKEFDEKMKEKLNRVRPSPPHTSLITSDLAEFGPRRTAPVQQLPYHNRQPDDLDRSPGERTRRHNSNDSTSASYDYTDDMEIDDAHAATGQKRKASPPAKDPAPCVVSTQSDAVRRLDVVASRGSPTPRLTVISPAPSGSLAGVSRPGSYMPPLSMLPAGNSYGRRSPGGVSPGGISPTSCSSPYATPTSLTHSPRSARVSAQGRAAASAVSPRKLGDVQKSGGGSKLQGFLMCDCCPKKPKKFETKEELSAHEAEKQYECQFCGNRFKNKNEAERHQNSLHVRRHSWSCSALSSCERAFHDSTNRPGEADTCGYCGDDFPRSGRGPGGDLISRHPTETDWDERIRHLQDVHKFGECNAAKKFYRADHFRQHLKHSHAGTSGKWTNMLENACMVEEDQSPR
ncbi:hypothetical protein L249_8375 [Ophiocordyceps polyrhachis-furcata BCC 54312]|uniref:C2H2-type domain-containing protein n=1 Tax=Ophiocordyceps polyrhachis-furcata BCC 54312 TaxID=1330021 RepID=A0A367L686_9HYPO|nr:hypothetical protein L249_8375 [Ophiocordyceps polyrhachis-furcata BCC 54312]